VEVLTRDARRACHAAVAFAAALCSVTLQAAVTVVDAAGRSVTLEQPPQRIVTIFSSNTELVDALGLGAQVVGIDDQTTYPPELMDRPRVSGRLGMSVDAVVAQRPDLVVLTPARQAMHQLIEPLRRLDIPAIVLMSRDMAEVFHNLRLLGVACGVPERGEAVAGALELRLATIRARVAGRMAPRVVMVTGKIGLGLVLIAREDTYTGDAVILAGGQFALSGATEIPQASPEAIWLSDPDILLFAGTQTDFDELLAQPGWRGLRAVQEGRTHIVSRGELLIPGPRTVDGIEHLAGIFHPQAPAQ
jgi:iron complex transport system substrate-binding protein